MARLESQSKLLFYPTPDSVVEQIARRFVIKHNDPVRLVDPCCGTGKALADFTNIVRHASLPAAPDIHTCGIEISYKRAEEAMQNLESVLPTSFYDVHTPAHWDDRSVSLAFNNPPYDWSQFKELRNGKQRSLRHELLFVEWTTPKIVPGGHHVIIVPQKMLGDPEYLGAESVERFARHINGWFDYVAVRCFPGELFDDFNQVVIFACNKREKYHAPSKENNDYIIDQCHKRPDDFAGGLLSLGGKPDLENITVFEIPPAPEQIKFSYKPTTAEDLVRLASACTPIGTPEYERKTLVRPIGAAFTPALPINLGHLTMLINAQETGLLRLENPARLVKGMTRKTTVVVKNENNANEDGEYTNTSVTTKEVFQSTLAIVDTSAHLLESAADISQFMVANAETIAGAVLTKNRALYNFDPTPKEWAIVGKSAQGLPPLPGRKERGLFDVQKHFAIAAARVMKAYKDAILNAEMGFGKTSTAIAALELLNQWPAITMCPGHMVWKWKRDLERSGDPDNPITARVITRPILDKPGNWPAIQQKLKDLNAYLVNSDRIQVEPEFASDTGLRRRLWIESPNAQVIGSALNCLTNLPPFRDPETGKFVGTKLIKVSLGTMPKTLLVDIPDRDEYTLADFVNDYYGEWYRNSRPPKWVAIVGFEAAKYDAGAVQCILKPHTRRVWISEEGQWKKAQVYLCPNCGEQLAAVPERCPKCDSPLFNFNRWRRVGLARLVQKKYKNFFKVYVADEVHKAQNGRTDIGVADQRLISSTRYNLALTGTLFGGNASSLFALLYRRVPEMRQEFASDDITRFVDLYGAWETSWTQEKPFEAGTGASTGIKRWGLRKRELPGVAPAIIRYLLPITLFGNITDLGYELPALYEEVQTLEMTGTQQEQYDQIKNDLLSDAAQLAMDGDPGGLSAWFAAARFRPASAWRDEVCHYEGKRGGIHMELPAVTNGDLLPKEQALVDLAKANKQHKRKTLVFVEQTGTRDIRERLVNALKKNRISVDQLSASDMAPARREAWIKNNAPALDVLLVNPKLVETGLDLVMFSDLVFFETTTSLYTLWQAMRRVWRLGQNKEVNVTFLTYAGTVEEDILRRMGVKMKYAQLLYGKEASGTLVETDGDDDVQREILQAALEGKVWKDAGQAVTQIFGTGAERTVRLTTEPSGSPLATSPSALVLDTPPDQPSQAQLTFFAPALATTGKQLSLF